MGDAPRRLSLSEAFSEGLSLAASRNGLLFVAAIFSLEIVTHLLYVSVYLPLDRSATVVGEPSSLPVGSELPLAESIGAGALTGGFTTLVTIPLTIIVIRTFVVGATERVPEAALFHRLGRAILSTFGAFAVIVITLAAVVGTSVGGFMLLVERTGGTMADPAVVLGIFLLIAWVVVFFTLVVVHVLFVGHEIAVRDRGLRGALSGSLALVRGNRVRVFVLALLYVGLTEVVRSNGFPAGPGTPGPLAVASVLVGSVLYAVAWVAMSAVLARAYRQLVSGDVEWSGDERKSESARAMR